MTVSIWRLDFGDTCAFHLICFCQYNYDNSSDSEMEKIKHGYLNQRFVFVYLVSMKYNLVE